MHHRDDIALVLGREESARQADEQQAGDPRQQQEDRETAHRAAEDCGIRAPVFLGHARDPAVEAAEKAPRCTAALFDPSAPALGQRSRFARLVLVCRIMVLDVFHPQESRAQRRRQRQRQHGGEEDRDRESDRELAVNPAGRAGEEGHRQEHCDQDQRDPDDRTGDLVHRLARCRKRAEPFFAHDALDILDHDDRVIDEDADRQHHAEQRQHVDRKAEQPQAQTSAGQRDRDHQRRDQRRAPVLQEQEHDEKDQHHRLDQRLHHFLDRNLDEGRGIVRDRPGDIVGQARADFGHPFVDPLGGCERIGACRQLDRHAGHRLTIERSRCGIALRADLDPRDIAQPDAGAARICAQDDPPELVLGLEPVLGRDRGGDLLAFLQRQRPQRPARGLRILLADRGHDRTGRKIVGSQLFGIEPDAHRIFGAEQRDIADAGHTAQFVDHLRRGDVAEIGRVERARFRSQRDDHQEACVRLAHGNALAADLFGQPGLDRAQPVLHLGLGDIDVGARFESQRDRGSAVRKARRGHVEEALDAVELLFDHLCDVLFERLGIGAGIDHVDRQRRRGDLGILFDRQGAQGDEARQQDAQRDHPGEDRPVDEETRHDQSAFAAGVGAAALRPVAALAICTGMPGCSFCRFDTITRSPGLSPLSTTQLSPISWPSLTGRTAALPSLSTIITVPPASATVTARCGMAITSVTLPA